MPKYTVKWKDDGLCSAHISDGAREADVEMRRLSEYNTRWVFKLTQRFIGEEAENFLTAERAAERERRDEKEREGKEWRPIPKDPPPPGFLRRLWARLFGTKTTLPRARLIQRDSDDGLI